MAGDPVRVFLVDPHPGARSDIATLVAEQTDLELVGQDEPTPAGFAQVLASQPDVVVACVGGDDEALHLCREMRVARPQIACVITSPSDDDEALVHAILIGADALASTHDGGRVVEAVRRAASHDDPLLEAIGRRLAEGLPRPASDPLAGLPDQQRAVVERVARGMTNTEIGEELDLSAHTVRNYLSSAMARLGARNRTEVASFVVYLAAAQRRVPPPR